MRRIFTVGFELPGSDLEYIEFESDRTLLDADIIIYQPTLGACDFELGQEYGGKAILSRRRSSFSTKEHLDHWHAEIVAAVNAGKLVIVYLVRPMEYCRYTGEQQYSGTGRSRVRTDVVTNVSSYEAVPNVKKVTPKSGSEIRLEKDGSYLAPYWSEFSKFSPYEIEIEGEFNKILLKSRVGNRTIGAAFHGKSGALLLLPPLRFDEEAFIRDSEEEGDDEDEYWTTEALEFGKRLVTALVGLADALKQMTQLTPTPNWVLVSEYRLALEDQLGSGITGFAAEILELQAKKAALERQLEEAGSLRRLLFEQGKPLEGAILEAMRLFGFDGQPFADGGSEFDGVFICPEGRCLGEAEGKDNKPINIEKFSQLERNLQKDFARDEVTQFAIRLLFGNAYRLKPVGDRSAFFTEKCVSAAKRVGAALVRTPDLFAPAKYLKENPLDADYAKGCREAIFGAAGKIVAFPSPPVGGMTSLAESAEVEGRIESDLDSHSTEVKRDTSASA
jgi:hypothetical protein